MTTQHADSIEQLLTPEAVPADHLAALHERLAERASEAGLIDVAYRTVDTPIGNVLVAATALGLVQVAFECQGFDGVLERLATAVSPRILAAPKRLDETARQLGEYFAGDRQTFDVPLDWSLAVGFRHEVLHHLPTIGYGHTASYGAVAAAVGNPKAVRAVGTACATNPLPLVIPCHRVVRSDGQPGEYAGGAQAKRRLLAFEAKS